MLFVIFGGVFAATVIFLPGVVAANVEGLFWFSLIILFTFLGFFRNFSQPIKIASFYEDYFTFVEDKHQRSFAYAEVEDVSIAKVPLKRIFPALELRNQISIRIKNVPKPVIIPANVKSARLGSDLYSWLVKKIVNSSAREALRSHR